MIWRRGRTTARHLHRLCWSTVVAAALALSSVGCSLELTRGARVERWETGVPDALRPQLARFQTALEARTTGQVEANSAPMKLFAAAFGATVNNYVDPVDATKLIDTAIEGIDNAPQAAEAQALVEAGITAMISSIDQGGAYLESRALRGAAGRQAWAIRRGWLGDHNPRRRRHDCRSDRRRAGCARGSATR